MFHQKFSHHPKILSAKPFLAVTILTTLSCTSVFAQGPVSTVVLPGGPGSSAPIAGAPVAGSPIANIPISGVPSGFPQGILPASGNMPDASIFAQYLSQFIPPNGNPIQGVGSVVNGLSQEATSLANTAKQLQDTVSSLGLPPPSNSPSNSGSNGSNNSGGSSNSGQNQTPSIPSPPSNIGITPPPSPSAPQVPSLPSAPTAPVVPTAPVAPNAPSAPTAPRGPTPLSANIVSLASVSLASVPAVSVQTSDSLGPLSQLVGAWQGNQGQKIQITQNGNIPHTAVLDNYDEMITFMILPNNSNQNVARLDYSQNIVYSTNTLSTIQQSVPMETQGGYWLWNSAQNQISQQFNSALGYLVLARGTSSATADFLDLIARTGTPNSNNDIFVAPGTNLQNAPVQYEMKITFSDANNISYEQNFTYGATAGSGSTTIKFINNLQRTE